MKDSKISWTDHTFNPWVGCEKVSAGCANCYAERQEKRWGRDFSKRRRTSAANWREPLKWNRQVGTLYRWDAVNQRKLPATEKVFCGSMCDWLDDQAPVEWLADLLLLVGHTSNLTWLLLTKRPGIWRKRLIEVSRSERGKSANRHLTYSASLAEDWGKGFAPPNVWIGTTAENQKAWDERVYDGLKIPAIRHFVSVEPMLEAIQMGPLALAKLDLVIFGGESGPHSRICNIEHVRNGVRQCRAAGVKCYVKQLGSKACETLPGQTYGAKLLRLRDPKGGDPAEWSEDLRVREWPCDS